MPYVTDTHSFVWYMAEDAKLSTEARKIFDKADEGKERIIIPCIVFFELLYLIEKRKVSMDLELFTQAVSTSENYAVEPLCLPIIKKTSLIPREKVGDPWDRLIAATALHLNVPLITCDARLRKVGLETIW